MTQKEQILSCFKEHGNKMTLGEILTYRWGYEARARFTELRREGFKIEFTKGKRPSDNLYVLTLPIQFDQNGQGSFI